MGCSNSGLCRRSKSTPTKGEDLKYKAEKNHSNIFSDKKLQNQRTATASTKGIFMILKLLCV